MIKNLFFFVFLALLPATTPRCFAQELLDGVPGTKEEFIASEKKVLATIGWLETTPFSTEEDKRTKQNALLIAWLTNSPTVTIEINADVLTFTKKHSELLMTFMGGWTRYCLQNNYSKDAIQGSLAGIRSVIKVYKNQSLKKDKEVEKLIELEGKGELENWVREKMEKR